MNINVKNSVACFLSLLLMLINVYLVIPLVAYIAHEKLKCISCIIPLSLSILAFNFIPTHEYDLYRIYESLSQYKINGEISYARDGLLVSLFYLFDSFSLNPSLLSAISCFFIYFSKIYIAQSFFDKNKSLNKNLLIIFIMISIFSVPLLQYSGIRFSSALAFLSLGLYFFSMRNKTWGVILYFLAVFSHASALLFILIHFTTSFAKFSFYKHRLVLIFISIIICFNTQTTINTIAYLSDYVNGFFGWSFFSVETYVDGAWGVERATSLNETGQLVLTLTKVALCTVLVVNILFFCTKEFAALLVSLTSITISLYDFGTLFDRFGQFCILVLIINMMYSYMYKRRDKVYILNCFFVLFLFLFFRALEFKNAFEIITISNSDVYKLSLANLLVEIFD